jgi:hypothetical protein
VTKPSALLPCTLGLGTFARHVNAVCIVATEIDQEQSNPLLKIRKGKKVSMVQMVIMSCCPKEAES